MERDDPAGEEQEVTHFLDVCYSIAQYEATGMQWVDAFGQRLCQVLHDPADRALWRGGYNPQDLLERMRYCVRYNQQSLLDRIVEDIGDSFVGPPGGLGARTPPPGMLQVPPAYQASLDNASKTRSTLKQFVRDWAQEGAAERERCYGPLLQSLTRYVSMEQWRPGQERPRVSTPGSGLGRLTFEVARRGYFAEGNEFSYHMLLGTMWVLNESEQANGTCIFPYVLDTGSRHGVSDNLRPVRIPDVCPSDFCDPACGFGEISMRGGEFVECYRKQVAQWDAVLTAFFVDTANNVFLYIRTIAAMIRPGGLWSNFGPLLWHYSPVGGGSHDAESVELSWEEVRPAIEKYFDIKEVEVGDAGYTAGVGSMRKLYHCIFFAALRNGAPVEGESKMRN
eukprot:TRINITY_DN55618_c0_g1_i1.p1 TRINITY_DN55618_c0_g1~~TRINITY_DN55618_c0_g1_i1.p1  ORF type:complete len:394 (+),score=73.69 TRINITY_DN55618_c0_g1_i1:64-1245(+)